MIDAVLRPILGLYRRQRRPLHRLKRPMLPPLGEIHFLSGPKPAREPQHTQCCQ